MNNSVTKLCTCRSAAERPGCACFVCVCTEFVSGSPPPPVAAVLGRPRHECDERLTSEGQTDTVWGKRGTLPEPDCGWLKSRLNLNIPVRQRTHTRAHPHTCVYRTVSLNRYRCADRAAPAPTLLIISIDKQGRGRACVKRNVMLVVVRAAHLTLSTVYTLLTLQVCAEKHNKLCCKTPFNLSLFNQGCDLCVY